MADVRSVTGPWEDLLIECATDSREVIRIASPFIKEAAARRLVGAKRADVELRYINAFKLQYFYSGASDLTALRVFLGAGGVVRSLQRLHSKLYLFDESRAIVTSANLTYGGLTGNFEYGVLIERPAFLAQVIDHFDTLFASEEQTGSITESEIDKAGAIIAVAPKKATVDFSKIAESLEDTTDQLVGGIAPIEKNLSGWMLDVFRCLQEIKSDTFELADVYRFEPDLRKAHPSNQHVTDKIRQQLQYLRNQGVLEFLGAGVYRKLWQE